MMDEVCGTADDLVLAEDLQLEEVLRFSAHCGTTCAVCREVMPSLEASWKPDKCDHVICITCFCQYASEAHATELPKCPVASCESLFRPETRREINVGDGSLTSIEEMDNGKGKSLTSIEEMDNGKGKSLTSIEEMDNGKGKSLTSIEEMDNGKGKSLTSIEEMDNGKGKKPWNDVLQEPGQCSRGVTTSRDFYCTICMETVHIREIFFIAGCTHAFCVSCVSQYIAAKVEENTLSIGCPDPGCKDGALHPEACRDVIPTQLFQRWGASLCDSALGALKFYCPFKDCSALLVDDPGDGEAAITMAECPHCCRMFCAQCKVPWHDGVDCAEFQRLGKDERGREDLLLRKVAQEGKWQRCPKCKMYVERVEGCVFIICRCGHCFCYLCASPMSRDNHCCKKCGRTW